MHHARGWPPRAWHCGLCSNFDDWSCCICVVNVAQSPADSASVWLYLMQGIMGVIDGVCPTDFETEDDKSKRHDFLRMIGYKR